MANGTIGDVERMALALQCFLGILTNDVRVQNGYAKWFAGRMGGELSKADDLGVVEEIVRELQLDLPFLSRLLLKQFAARAVGEAFTGEPWFIGIEGSTKDVDGNAIGGRRAKNDGDNIPRDVEWFYRVRVRKGPGDSVRAIAREYATANARHTDARSVVQSGVKRIERLLDGFRE